VADWGGGMFDSCCKPRVQLFDDAGNRWPHSALRYQYIIPISCHFRDCKANYARSAIAIKVRKLYLSYASLRCIAVAKLVQSFEAPDPVHGLAVLDKKLYVLRKRQADQIYVYDTKDYKLQTTITVDGLQTPHCYSDLTECKAERCVIQHASSRVFSRPYFSNGRAINMVVVVCPSVCHGCIVVKR